MTPPRPVRLPIFDRVIAEMLKIRSEWGQRMALSDGVSYVHARGGHVAINEAIERLRALDDDED